MFGDLSLDSDFVCFFVNSWFDLFGLGFAVLVRDTEGSLTGVILPFDFDPRFFMSFGLGTKAGSI